jgi:hypothetical protein
MTALITLAGLVGMLAGVALGWYLRRINAWCPECGETLACSDCGGRPIQFAFSRARRPAR